MTSFSSKAVVVVKWGGGLITDKRCLCTPNLDIIAMLAQTIVECHKKQINVILVHGAGSYGHLRCKTWRVNEGDVPSFEYSDEECSSQFDAVKMVQQDLLELNKHVADELSRAGIANITYSPHLWARGLGPTFEGDLTPIKQDCEQGKVVITHGDVVPVDGDMKFGILSGDDLVVRLCLEIPNVKRLVFAIGGVDGLLKHPPKHGKRNQNEHAGPLTTEHIDDGDALIKEWSSGVNFHEAPHPQKEGRETDFPNRFPHTLLYARGKRRSTQ